MFQIFHNRGESTKDILFVTLHDGTKEDAQLIVQTFQYTDRDNFYFYKEVTDEE
jgi:hypothetical protein